MATIEELKEVVLELKNQINDERGYPGMPVRYTLDYTLPRPLIQTLIEFDEYFYNFLFKTKLLPLTKICPNCGHQMKLRQCNGSSDLHLWYCGYITNKRRCVKKLTIRHGTWFHNSKLCLQQMLILTCKIAQGHSFKEMLTEWRFSPKTISDWICYVWEAVLEHLETNSTAIGGLNTIVEIDEVTFRLKNKRGQSADEHCVLGGIQRNSNNVFLVALPDETEETLTGLIKQMVLPGTAVVTNGWNVKTRLGHQGYNQLIVNHILTFKESTDVPSNIKDTAWKRIKASLSSNTTSFETFDYHLGKLLFQIMTQNSEVDAFLHFLKIITNMDWTDKVRSR